MGSCQACHVNQMIKPEIKLTRQSQLSLNKDIKQNITKKESSIHKVLFSISVNHINKKDQLKINKEIKTPDTEADFRLVNEKNSLQNQLSNHVLKRDSTINKEEILESGKKKISYIYYLEDTQYKVPFLETPNKSTILSRRGNCTNPNLLPFTRTKFGLEASTRDTSFFIPVKTQKDVEIFRSDNSVAIRGL